MYSIKSYPFQEPNKISRFTRFMWWCAGADKDILAKCTYSDHVKYFGLGGIVLATGFLAAVSGGYAFYTIFAPKELQDTLSQQTDIGSMIAAFLFAAVWGIIIFNLDRFVLSSTGKGDGTEAITWKEFTNAIPRIIMALILSIAIAAPLEIRIFKTEIDAELFKVQKEKIHELNRITDERFADRLADAQADKEKLEIEIKQKQDALDKLRIKLQEEIAGRIGSGKGGIGPAANQIKEDILVAERDLKKLETRNNSLLLNVTVNIEDLKKQRDEEYISNENQAKKLDGLLQRILLAEEIAGTSIIWLIRMIFIVIETGPIFFKLMIIKSPYDYLEENMKEEIKARAGIFAFQTVDNRGYPAIGYKSISIEQMVDDKKKLYEAQAELAEHILEEWKKKEKEKISLNPDEYIKKVQ